MRSFLLPGSGVEIRLEHRFLRVLEKEVLERGLEDVDVYIRRYRLNAATRLVQLGRRWEDPNITEAQADALIEQVQDAGVSFLKFYTALANAFYGNRVGELRPEPEPTADENGDEAAGKKSPDPAAALH